MPNDNLTTSESPKRRINRLTEAKQSGYIPDGPVWLVFDLCNGHPGSQQYVWWFRTRKEARDHIKHVSKTPHGVEYSAPQLWIKSPNTPTQHNTLTTNSRRTPSSGTRTQIKPMETNTNTPEARQPASVGCYPKFCSYPVYSSKPEVAAIELLDGAYDIIEIWKAETPSQKAWKVAWLSKARALGANPSW